LTFGGPYLLAPLPSLLGIRPGMRVSVLNPPDGFLQKLAPLPEGVSLLDQARTGLDVTIFFTTRKVELVEKLSGLARGMAVTGTIWVCFPHALEGPQVPTEDFVRLAALEIGLTDNKLLLLDPAWSGLRLIWKPRSARPEKPTQATA
jgi:hypothetical protein